MEHSMFEWILCCILEHQGIAIKRWLLMEDTRCASSTAGIKRIGVDSVEQTTAVTVARQRFSKTHAWKLILDNEMQLLRKVLL